MKKVLVMLMCVGLLSVSLQADLILGAGDIYVDAADGTPGNTTFDDGTFPFSAASTTSGLWTQRISANWGYNDAGEFMVADSDVFQAMSSGYGAEGPCQDLKTTVSGLVDGQEYAVYVVYSSKQAGENWATAASFDPLVTDAEGTITSGVAYGIVAESYTPGTLTTVDILAGTVIDASTYSGMMGLVGNVTGDATGLLDVYVGYVSDLCDNNHRSWYDGIYLQAVPEPATMILLGLGGLLLRRKR